MSRHDHDHGHDYGHTHCHRHHGADNERRVFWAMLLTGGFMAVEVVGGLVSGSLALLADAAHMLTDFAALALAWIGFRISRRPADSWRSYGYHRFEVLAAFVNGIVLIVIVIGIAIEAIERFFQPVAVLGGAMLAVAVVGLIVNLAAFLLLHGGDRSNLNVRGAAAHVLGDLFGSVGAIVAASLILATGWTPIDPLLSLLVGALILRTAWSIVLDSGHILLEGTPRDMDTALLASELRDAVAEVQEAHHVHVWSLTPQRSLMTLHITVDQNSDQDQVLQEVKLFLEKRWQVGHSTIQVERAACPDELCKD